MRWEMAVVVFIPIIKASFWNIIIYFLIIIFEATHKICQTEILKQLKDLYYLVGRRGVVG